MSQTLPRPMTADEFLEWDLLQPDGRHELVDGVPILKDRDDPTAMTGARMRHDDIVANVIAQLWNQLRGHKCRPFTADIAVRSREGGVRRPDVGVRCPPFDDRMTAAPAPVLLVEVLSPSTRSIDLLSKLEEYKSIPSVRYIVIVDPELPEVLYWHRDQAVWRDQKLKNLNAVVEMSEPPMRLALADIYEGIAFPPRLVS